MRQNPVVFFLSELERKLSIDKTPVTLLCNNYVKNFSRCKEEIYLRSYWLLKVVIKYNLSLV